MGRIEYRALPVPAFPEYTVRIAAGAVTFGVEYRHLDEATILAAYGSDARDLFDNKRPAGMSEIVEEDGLALHVFDSATGDELLRFDCFDEAAHYHYLTPSGPRNVVIEHDNKTEGPLVDWALNEMRKDLRAMLTEAGAAAAAARLAEETVGAGPGAGGEDAPFAGPARPPPAPGWRAG